MTDPKEAARIVERVMTEWGKQDSLRDMLEEITAELLAGEGNSVAAGAAPFDPWQPISTAPKDGTEIILAHFMRDGDRHLCLWAEESLWLDELLPHWFLTTEREEGCDRYPPTHWMLLHSPGANASGEKAGLTQASDSLARPSSSPFPAVRDAPTADQMFNGLAHGDATHRAWLREAIDALFSGKPAPSPIMGKTREEVIVEAEEARENEVWDEVLKRVQSAWVAPRSYMQSPLELITDLINERDEAVRDVTLREALEEIQRLCMTRDNYGPGIRSKVELESRLSEIVEICHAVCTSPLSPPEGGEDEKN